MLLLSSPFETLDFLFIDSSLFATGVEFLFFFFPLETFVLEFGFARGRVTLFHLEVSIAEN